MTLRTITFDDEQWQLVPQVATREQVHVGATLRAEPLDTDRARKHHITCVYEAMLAAAPEPPAQQPVIQAVFRCGPSGEPGDDFIGEKEAPLWGLPEIEDDGSITVPIDHWPTPAQQPTRDLLAEATEQFEALERENHRMRRCVARLMARLTVWLDDDQFNEADGIMSPEFEPPAQQPSMEAAIAAGDGTLHGAIDHWQSRALAAEAMLRDCAEALRGVLEILPICPKNTGLVGIEAKYEAAVVAARVALARLNGDDHAG